MSDTPNTPDTPAAAPEDLDERVQALLDAIEQTTARIEQAVADDADELDAPDNTSTQPAATADPPPEPPEPPELTDPAVADPAPTELAPTEASADAPEDAPAEPVSAEIDDALHADPTPVDPPPTPTPPSPATPQSLDALDANLEADLDRLLAAEQPGDTTAATAAGAPEGIETDPHLESELDALLREGEISAPEVGPAPELASPSALDQQLAGLKDDDLEGGPDPSPASPEPEPAPTPAPEAAAPMAASAATAAQPTPTSPPKRSLLRATLVELADFARRSGPRVASQVEPVAYQTAAAMSRPLKDQRKAKQIIGWLAIYTAFLAACVWVYVLFLRPAGPPENSDGAAIVGVQEGR